MKQFLIITFVFWSLMSNAQDKPPKADLDTLPEINLPDLNQKAFGAGEYLRFRLHYGLIDAGEAELKVYRSGKKFNGRDTYHVIGTGRTLGAFNWFYKVRDRYETFLDTETIVPWEFVRQIREGGYSKDENYRFHQHKAAVSTHKGDTFKIPKFSQDMLSSFYFARTLDFSNAREGDIYTIPTFVDEEEYPLRIKYLGREKLKSRTGTYQCLKFVPVVQEGRIFEKEEDMIVWITDDENKIPILAKAKVLVGSIRMELVEYDNLSNPLAKVD